MEVIKTAPIGISKARIKALSQYIFVIIGKEHLLIINRSGGDVPVGEEAKPSGQAVKLFVVDVSLYGMNVNRPCRAELTRLQHLFVPPPHIIMAQFNAVIYP